MKREREKKYYYVYGNLSERFANNVGGTSLDYILDNQTELDFQTSYPNNDHTESALKIKHYTQLLHTVTLDYFNDFIPENLFELTIEAEEKDKNIHLHLNIKPRKDEVPNECV